jgi:hypothetical protein
MNAGTPVGRQRASRSLVRIQPARARLAFLVLASLAIAVPSAAQIVPCSGIQDRGFKILLDDIFDAAGGAASPLMQSLIYRLSTNLEQLQVESGLPLKVVRCAKRRPSDPSEFRRPLVEQLNARQVVLEVWGTTAKATDQTGAEVHEATVGYLLVPVRFDEFTDGQPSGAFLLSRQAKSVTSVDELVRLVDQAGELAAYVAVSTGVKLLRSKEYDQARAQLCRSEALLTRAAGPTPSARDKTLIGYVQRMAADVVTQAKADPAYAGVLKALPVSTGGCR